VAALGIIEPRLGNAVFGPDLLEAARRRIGRRGHVRILDPEQQSALVGREAWSERSQVEQPLQLERRAERSEPAHLASRQRCFRAVLRGRLGGIVRGRDREIARDRSGRARLLDGVRELVGQDPASALAIGCVAPLAQHHVLSDGVAQRSECARRRRGDRIRVQPDPPEVPAEARFEERARARVERLSGRAQRLLDEPSPMRGRQWATC
jgi:hypothetical protein